MVFGDDMERGGAGAINVLQMSANYFDRIYSKIFFQTTLHSMGYALSEMLKFNLCSYSFVCNSNSNSNRFKFRRRGRLVSWRISIKIQIQIEIIVQIEINNIYSMFI